MLAWRDEWNEVNLKRCWSEQIRADFRSMDGGEREGWRRLLHSIDGDEGVRPAPACSKLLWHARAGAAGRAQTGTLCRAPSRCVCPEPRYRTSARSRLN